MEDPEQYIRMKTAFYNQLDELIKVKHVNNQIFSHAAYLSMIAKVEHAKGLKFGKTPSDYARLKKFDILEIDGCKRLVVPFFCSSTSSGNKTSGGIRMFVYIDEIFDLLHTAHLKIGHKRRMGMSQEVSQFKNITREMIKLYLSICELCQEKIASKTQEKDPKISCIDFIGMPTDKHGYNLILLHIDVKTQFVQLRSLKNTNVNEVTHLLLDIFSIFGPPDVLQGNIAFGEILVSDLICNWSVSECKLTFNMTEGNVELLEVTRIKITQLLNHWTQFNKNLQWSDGIKFVQYMKNKEYNNTLTRSAGEAMFGNTFGRTIVKKRMSEEIVQATSKGQKTDTEVEENSSEVDDTQNQQVQMDSLAKKIKVEPKVMIQKIEIIDNEVLASWKT